LLDDAGFHYRSAAAQFDELRQHEDAVATGVALSWLHIQREDPALAAETLDDLETEDPRWNAVIDRTRALACGAAWERTAIVGSDLVAMIARGLGEILDGEPLSQAQELRATLQGRLVRALGGGRPSVAEPTQRAALIVGPEGQWFQTTGDVVSLRRRKAHRRILAELAQRYIDGADPLDVYDAFDLGWPGESVEPEIASERVYWVVGVLRRLGLDGILLTSDAGYYLDPEKVVRRARPTDDG
jgi:hypothetical protein